MALQVFGWDSQGRSGGAGGAMTTWGRGGSLRGGGGQSGGVGGDRASWTPDIPWIRRKKQLELVEAKHAKQAESLRQVRTEPRPEGEGRLRVWVETGQVREDGEGCATSSLIGAPLIPGRAADGGGLGQLSGAERSPAGTAPSAPRAAHVRLPSNPRAAPPHPRRPRGLLPPS